MKPGTLTLIVALTLAVGFPIASTAQERTAGAITQANPVPIINQPLVPDAVAPGGPAFTLTVNGTGFGSSSVVNWNGSARKTTFVNGSELKASILSSDIARAGTASVTVANPAPGGSSNVEFFEVTLHSLSMALTGPTDFPTGVSPVSATTGDFNADGKLDLAVANAGNTGQTSTTVSILLGNGDGTFEPHVDYQVGNNPVAAAVGDFNGDGKLDLAVTNVFSDTVSILLGNGDGTFQTHRDYATGSEPGAVVAADFNGDGKLDVALTHFSANNVSILLGNGDGTFQAYVDYGAGSGPASMVVGDFNGDANLDLTVADYSSNSVGVLLGNGEGGFQPAANYAAGAFPYWIGVGDLNGDGKPDLAAANSVSNDVSILLGNGDGTFQRPLNTAVSMFPDWVALGDFNGDSKLDLAVAFGAITNGTKNVSVLLGNGDGTFGVPVSYGTACCADPGAVGDFNSDGRIDLAVVNPENNLNVVSVFLQGPSVLLSKTSLTFADRLLGTSSPPQRLALTAGFLPITITRIAITGTDAADFAQTNTCGTGLAAGASCTISATFTPTQIGPRAASITITDSAVGSPHSVALSGIGVTSGPNATLSATSLTFALLLVGLTSPPQSVTLTNYGTAALSITGIATTGDFGESNTCGSSLAPGKSCAITVSFTPTQAGTRTGNLSISDNAPGSPQTVALTGTGTNMAVVLNPSSLSFGNVVIRTSKALTTSLTNAGNTTLSITSMIITGGIPRGGTSSEFSQTNTCGTTVGAGGSCTITITFRPYASGTVNGTLAIYDNAMGSPQLVSLTGTGTGF